MARGWESKAVEDQIESSRQKNAAEDRVSLTPVMLEQKQRRDTLLLARSQMMEQITRTRSELHQQRLRESLAEIDRQLAALNPPLNTDF